MFNDYDVYQMNYFQSGVGGILGCLQYLFPNAVDPWFRVDQGVWCSITDTNQIWHNIAVRESDIGNDFNIPLLRVMVIVI